MKTAPLVVAVVSFSVLPAVLSSFGCNKKEDVMPAPSATAVVAPPPTTAAPAATPLLPTQPNIPLIKTTGPYTDAAARAVARTDAAPSVAHADAAAPPVVGLPPGLPTIALPHPSAIPGIASSVLGGIIQNLPPPIMVPPPNPTQ